MPKISDERRARRKREIMEAAWRCFAVHGFHATSMDDVIRASGASASGVYRYVSGKDELIAEAGRESMRVIRGRLMGLAAKDPVPTPAEAIAALLAGSHDPDSRHFYLLALQAWAEALRSPEVAAGVAAFYRELHTLLGVLVQRWSEAGMLGDRGDPEATSYALAMLVPGMLVNEHLIDPVDPQRLAAALTSH